MSDIAPWLAVAISIAALVVAVRHRSEDSMNRQAFGYEQASRTIVELVPANRGRFGPDRRNRVAVVIRNDGEYPIVVESIEIRQCNLVNEQMHRFPWIIAPNKARRTSIVVESLERTDLTVDVPAPTLSFMFWRVVVKAVNGTYWTLRDPSANNRGHQTITSGRDRV